MVALSTLAEPCSRQFPAGDCIFAICSSSIYEGEARNEGGPDHGKHSAFRDSWKKKVRDVI